MKANDLLAPASCQEIPPIMDLLGSTARKSGTRGGKDQFKWEDVAKDKHRGNYLGHSVKLAQLQGASASKDPLWYEKRNTEPGSAAGAGTSLLPSGKNSQLSRHKQRVLIVKEQMARIKDQEKRYEMELAADSKSLEKEMDKHEGPLRVAASISPETNKDYHPAPPPKSQREPLAAGLSTADAFGAKNHSDRKRIHKRRASSSSESESESESESLTSLDSSREHKRRRHEGSHKYKHNRKSKNHKRKDL